MIDVHPPNHGISGIRDFLIHLLTITIGLLIALGLEALVEASHHRHLRREADANIRQEIRDNQHELAATRAAISQENKNLTDVMAFLRRRITHQPSNAHSLSLSYTLGTMHDSSWRTASSTGALSYMDYPEVKRYAEAYLVQDEYVRLQRATLDDFLQLQSYAAYDFNPETFPPAEAAAAEVDVRRTIAHLTALDQFGDSLSRTYKSAIGEK